MRIWWVPESQLGELLVESLGQSEGVAFRITQIRLIPKNRYRQGKNIDPTEC